MGHPRVEKPSTWVIGQDVVTMGVDAGAGACVGVALKVGSAVGVKGKAVCGEVLVGVGCKVTTMRAAARETSVGDGSGVSAGRIWFCSEYWTAASP